MKHKTVRLSDDECRALEDIAARKSISQSEAIRFAITFTQTNDKSHLDRSDEMDITKFLKEQIEIKDKQIEELMRSLNTTQESLKQSQILNAVDKRVVLPTAFEGDDESKEGFFSRLFHRR